MTSSFELVTLSSARPDALFGISLDIDAHIASMSSSGERAVAGVVTGRIGPGETVTWRARHFGVWFSMTSKIVAYEPNVRFVDAQVRGPFRTFVHEHRFEEIPGGTRMIDVITLASPVFGVVAERLVLVPYLRRLIQRRNAQLVAAVG
ncbi:SRPBCC family protein [Microbacterium dextranolyticum]|uniref:Cyclase n=1 Tax=Microbacterium dextranolyticum TaxID=36806 RepID=A0A9W6HNU9_9MICO|nr:SRPBCC family protein [Microbacterium dextranolyticum]MBM7462971.1 ligand-binding SRPBCC domain-containing protein [Microbacterium dextranolyticum]GLJ95923.1 hypothetical protein GCM10017591_19860 [Microbacterium dextranolyticum]